MSVVSKLRLRALLEANYQQFRLRLRRRLGSDAMAMEVLHDTWLRLDRIGDASAVQKPAAYLFRMALNEASDRREADARKLSAAEIETLRHMSDQMLDPEQIAQARREVTQLAAALDELPPRRKAIVLLARVHEMKHTDIAVHFGISPRMVEKELVQALEHCARRLERKVVRRFGPRSQKPS
ncbi:sigma-24 (FecI-like) [Rhodopseudomonas palustris HaA2]|uniref:Sigma-24 (FecI-like) n=1 Tax=Rhodopseudomonas palustris (strain HaA2) TaxID=316058 RepID=Q2IXX3_RHOP2|nr:RNA polymerase sigma factor [Rhodopseudomonas palustris]ABD06937.1 sigma-24 (FecI-like) [Rhodopseudomonas palustris HaA2]